MIDREELKRDINYLALINGKYLDRIIAIWGSAAQARIVEEIVNKLPEKSLAQLKIQVNNTMNNIKIQMEKDMTA